MFPERARALVLRAPAIMSVRTFSRLAFASSAFAIGLLQTSSASAETGFSVNRFETSERGSEWFVLDTLDIHGHARPAIGVVGEWSYRPLVLYDANGDVKSSIVRNQVFVHPGASIVMWERLRLAFDLPVLVYTDGRTATLRGVTYPAPASETALGDLRLAADVRVFGEVRSPASLALGLRGWLPTGDQDSYAGDGSVRFAPQAMFAGELGTFAYAARAGFTYRDTSGKLDSGAFGSELTFAASAGLRVLDGKLLLGPEIFGTTTTAESGAFTKKGTPLEGILGGHLTVARDLRIGAGVGAGITRGFGSPVLRTLLSVEWAPALAVENDRDHDGVLDNDDACPDTFGVHSDDPKQNGCPIVDNDRDRDGILDPVDACIDVPGIHTDDKATDGCPDTDRDGIVDTRDACVQEPGPRSSNPKTTGCPDTDGDGIVDREDACPKVAGVRSDDAAKNGCPVNADRDKDGIPNEKDACPDEPGKPDPDPKRNGCPAAFVQNGEIKILDQVKFKTASAEILKTKDSEDVLEAVRGVLAAHPEIKHLRVEGHTDNKGAPAMNKKLSADRAASVVKWLAAHGIDKGRMTSAGFGQEKPLDSNDTESGRQNNRRVEFKIDASESNGAVKAN